MPAEHEELYGGVRRGEAQNRSLSTRAAPLLVPSDPRYLCFIIREIMISFGDLRLRIYVRS